MGEIPGSNLEELSLGQGEMLTQANTHLWALWCLMNGAESYTATPPGSPVNGRVYIIASGATGVWSGKDEQVALRIAGAWHYLDDPQEGWRLWVKDENLYRRYQAETSSTSYDESGWIIDDPDKVVQTLTPGDNVTVDWSLGRIAEITLDRATTTFAFSGADDGQSCILRLKQDGTGGRNAAFGTEVREGDDLPLPASLSAANLTDLLGFLYCATDAKYDFVSLQRGF